MPTKPLQERKWWSVKETAQEYGISKYVVYRAIKAGKVRYQKWGRSYRIDHENLDTIQNIREQL